jgi:hypothetical protein
VYDKVRQNVLQCATGRATVCYMSEIKSRSIRLDDENWEWLSGLPGRSANEAVGALRGETAAELGEVLEFVRSAPSEFEEACLRAIERWKSERPGSAQIPSTFQQGDLPTNFDPASIPGVSTGAPKVEGQWPCRCVHSGCRGSKFIGVSRFQNLCDECREVGHLGDARSCRACEDDSATGAI